MIPEIFFLLENARESGRNILMWNKIVKAPTWGVCKGLLIIVLEGQQFLKGVLLEDRENLGRAKIFGAQGFFSIAQGENIYVKYGGENFKNRNMVLLGSEPLLARAKKTRITLNF